MGRSLLQFLGGRRSAALERMELHLISAYDLLQARAEAQRLADGDAEATGLCLNACILARAAKREGKPVFADGKALLQAVPAERIRDWAKEYLALCAEQNFVGEDREALQQELKEAAYERLKWRVLRAFGVLPSEQRAREMTEGDYLYCVMQLTLDEEAALEGLCPGCRAEAMERRCAVCGGTLAEENPQFDEARFEELRRGGLHSDAAADADGAGTGS